MNDDLDFLSLFPKDRDELFIVYELYTFDNLFRLLLKNNFEHEEAFYFILANCSLSALVFQERLHNKKYRKLSAKDALPPEVASEKAQLISCFMSIVKSS